MNLTQEQKRIRIAEACGYKWWPSPHNPEQSILAKNQEDANSVNVGLNVHHLAPDYFRDLNAMHEAEKSAFTGKPDLWSRYLDDELPQGCGDDCATECAPAEIRAEAFGRTLNLW